MTEYSKKTVAELQEILKSNSLPHTGKKAELISRLQDFDKTKEPTTEAPNPSSAGAEDEIDWDDDGGVNNGAAKASTEAGAALIAAGGKGPVANPQAVPNQQAAVDPSTTDDLTVSAPGEPTAAATTEKGDTAEKSEAPKEEAAPAKDFSQGMKATDFDEELEKRKKRAAKFGTTLETTDEKEAAQKVERAKRFGVAADSGEAVKGLDEALPERTRKRGRTEEDGGRGGKRRDFGGRGRNWRRGGGGGGGEGRRENGEGAPKANYSEKDRLAAEARKKRFATTA